VFLFVLFFLVLNNVDGFVVGLLCVMTLKDKVSYADFREIYTPCSNKKRPLYFLS